MEHLERLQELERLARFGLTTSSSHYPSHWVEKLCAMLSVEGWRTGVFPHQVVRFFTAQGKAEGGNATWNPLNTTEPVESTDFGHWYTSPDYNSIGVRNYKTPALGIMATSVTYLSGKFDLLLNDLRTADATGITAEQLVQNHRAEIKLWGTSPDLMLQLLAEMT